MIENTSFPDNMMTEADDNIQPNQPATHPIQTATSMEVITPGAGYSSSSSASSLLMHSSMPSNPTTIAINTDIKKTKSSSSSFSSASSSSSLASVTVDGIQFVRSDMKGIYLRVDDKGIEQISSGPFVDFQVILNDNEFQELQQRKKALTRIRQHNNS